MPYFEALKLVALIMIGILFICGGIQGYQAFIGNLKKAGALEWPLRILFIIGGFIIATPGGGIVPITETQIVLLGLAFLVPAALVALILIRRHPDEPIPA